MVLNIQKLVKSFQDQDLLLKSENNIRGGISSVIGGCYVKSDENKKKLYKDATNLKGYSLSQPLLYDKIEMWQGDPDLYMNRFEEILDTPDDSDTEYFIEVDFSFLDNMKEKTENVPFAPENKVIPKDNYNDYMKKIQPKSFTEYENLISDWTDKKNSLIHYRMLKFYAGHGMVVDKIHEIISFKQNRWLEEEITFNTQKRNKCKNGLEKDFYKLLKNVLYGKTMENVRNRLGLEVIKKEDYTKVIKQHSKLTFNGIYKLYENCDSYVLRKIEVVMDKQVCLGVAVLGLCKLHMYETYYDKLQPYFGEKNLHLHYMDTDSFILNVNTKHTIKELKNLEDIFDISNLDKNHELFSKKNEKVVGIFKRETPKNFWIDEFIAMRSKMYSFKCGDDSKNKLKGFFKSQSKHIKFEDYYNCLFGGENQKDCDTYIMRSINHEMYLQQIKKLHYVYLMINDVL